MEGAVDRNAPPASRCCGAVPLRCSGTRIWGSSAVSYFPTSRSGRRQPLDAGAIMRYTNACSSSHTSPEGAVGETFRLATVAMGPTRSPVWECQSVDRWLVAYVGSVSTPTPQDTTEDEQRCEQQTATDQPWQHTVSLGFGR